MRSKFHIDSSCHPIILRSLFDLRKSKGKIRWMRFWQPASHAFEASTTSCKLLWLFWSRGKKSRDFSVIGVKMAGTEQPLYFDLWAGLEGGLEGQSFSPRSCAAGFQTVLIDALHPSGSGKLIEACN
jgi:hypothetical protein